MAIEYERFPWCDECEAFAVPTDAGECGSEVVFPDAEELHEQRREERRAGDGS
jgi:hypothetical protein